MHANNENSNETEDIKYFKMQFQVLIFKCRFMEKSQISLST